MYLDGNASLDKVHAKLNILATIHLGVIPCYSLDSMTRLEIIDPELNFFSGGDFSRLQFTSIVQRLLNISLKEASMHLEYNKQYISLREGTKKSMIKHYS